MKCLFLYNPKSGKEKINKKIDYIVKRLKEKFDIVDVHSSSSKLDFINTSKEACGVYDYLIFSGGDGSFNLIINSIALENNKPILGYIPSGTCNDIALNFNLPKYSLRKTLDIILNNNYYDHDIFKVNNNYCMYISALGNLSELAHNTNHSFKKIFGKIAYYLKAIKIMLNKSINLKVNISMDKLNYTFDTPLCLVMNSKYIAGLKINSSGYLNDGKLDVYIVKGKSFKGLFNIICLFLFGLLKIKTENNYYFFRSNKFSIECKEDKYWSFDGEKGIRGKLEFECIPKAIKVIRNIK